MDPWLLLAECRGVPEQGFSLWLTCLLPHHCVNGCVQGIHFDSLSAASGLTIHFINEVHLAFAHKHKLHSLTLNGVPQGTKMGLAYPQAFSPV